jgi:acyl-CoA thioester hydrolase
MSRFHEQSMGVYFDDLDPWRILHNARYILLFERTLGSFWRSLGYRGLQSDEPEQTHLVRANHIEYHSPVVGACEVRVRVWVEKIGRTSMTFGFRVMPMDEDRDHATGSRTIVCVDPATRLPTPWAENFRERIAPWMGPA